MPDTDLKEKERENLRKELATMKAPAGAAGVADRYSKAIERLESILTDSLKVNAELLRKKITL